MFYKCYVIIPGTDGDVENGPCEPDGYEVMVEANSESEAIDMVNSRRESREDDCCVGAEEVTSDEYQKWLWSDSDNPLYSEDIADLIRAERQDNMREISTEDLRRMEGQEALVLQGCGGDLQQWVDGINGLLTEVGVLRDGTKFTDVASFQHDGLTNLLFPINDDVKVNMGKLAIWRIQTHDQYGGTWLSDYVPNSLGGFISEEPAKQKPEMELVGHDGNIFSIMGRASQLLRRAGMEEEAKEMQGRVMASGNYDVALQIISQYVRTELSAEPETPAKSPKKQKRPKSPER